MSNKYINKAMYSLCSIGFFVIISSFLISVESRECLGLPIISENELEGYIETTELDISQMEFNSEEIAVDFPGNSIFISQPLEKILNVHSLFGRIVTTNPEYSLAVLDTVCLNNLSETVQNGRPLTLIIRSGKLYQKVNLIITTLPILYLDFDSTSEDEQGRTLNVGEMILWNNYNSSESYSNITSMAEWRLRGNSTRSFSKKAWKLNLRKENGENNNLNLTGLGDDDDWILNPMSMDDTFIKEKLTQNLWNQIVSNTSHNYKMSKGEYVELFINGAYQGLYLLQRRIDTKYLGLDSETDILIKGINTWEGETLSEGYEIVSTPIESDQTYLELGYALAFEHDNCINIDNFIDVSLLIQFVSGYDNSGYKNMFYAMKNTDNAYELFLVPWDTDLSFGVTWGYNYEGSLNAIIERQEMWKVREEIQDVDLQLAKRWGELRYTVFSKENILSIYDSITEELNVSGAIQRDQEKWGVLHKGKDNLDNLKNFIQERLTLLDNYYSQYEINTN